MDKLKIGKFRTFMLNLTSELQGRQAPTGHQTIIWTNTDPKFITLLHTTGYTFHMANITPTELYHCENDSVSVCHESIP